MLRRQLSAEDFSRTESKPASSESQAEVEVDSRRKLNRSFTLSGGGVKELRSFAASHGSDPPSPLKRFSKAKEDIANIFTLLHDRLRESHEFVSLVHRGAECKQLKALLERTEGIMEVLRRDHMKVVFFGRSSNGKSTVINSLLGERLLPSGLGSTTSCFCSVMGVDEPEGYLIHPNSQERQNVKNVRQLAHCIHKERLDPNNLIQIFWPKTRCALLSGEVEMVDSPGIGFTPDLDDWIDKFCLDADVFVLVANSESVLMDVEKKFFHRVSERLSKPNIFILNNRWDASAQEDPDEIEEFRKQHLKVDIDFLAHELSVVDEATARERVFFVSGREVLHERTKHERTKRQMGTMPEEEEGGRNVSDGWKVRMMDFERFEESLKLCISNSAIHTKFEHHYEQGSEVVHELEALLEQELKDLSSNILETKEKGREAMGRSDFLKVEGDRVHSNCQNKVDAAANEVEMKLAAAIKGAKSNLPSLVEKFQGIQFSRESLKAYQHKLCEFVDKEISDGLEMVATTSLSQVHESAKQDMIACYQSQLKLPLLGGKHIYQQVKPPPFSFAMKCANDFSPNPEFDFFRSIGLSNLQMKSLEPVLGGVSSRVSQLWSVLPTEYAIPLVLLGGAFLLPKVISWRVWLVSILGYSSLYAFKRATHDPERDVKDQLVRHVRAKLNMETQSTCRGYKVQVQSGLELLLGALRSELGDEAELVSKAIATCNQELRTFEGYQTRCRNLKNTTQLMRNDFEEFKATHFEVD